jgi:hypothetical protein
MQRREAGDGVEEGRGDRRKDLRGSGRSLDSIGGIFSLFVSTSQDNENVSRK